ncbi:hypothetical protein D9758_016475 [Tetrapyrgos nigripes]|uniref:DNA 3'-5' helicase n=1 Tax=Tetrapyrgos nigripes TaxID=182062 RepID=A0A8H5FQ33_9AGAR|nr:hypothetical protein D9758_016475 [Tetrapyrgos nigripes]
MRLEPKPPPPMPPALSFRSSEGQQALRTIVMKLIPHWPTGLREFQSESISHILDNQDLFAITATGDGKSALFAIPILVHAEVANNPTLYPSFSVTMRKKPVGIVITPTKGLANNIVYELQHQFRIPAFAYTQNNVSDASRNGRNIVKEIIDCKFQIVCVDPEHLRKPEWTTITDSEPFRSNVIFGCTEEAHVVEEWGLGFRPLFRLIGSFFRGRLPSSISRFAMTATMLPGAPYDSVCSSLGFHGPNFHLIRCSNECPNVQIDIEELTTPLGGREFPQLLPYLNQRRKTIIHVKTIELGYRVFLYLFKNAPKTYNRHCLAIATKAFSLGIHADPLEDSICVGDPDTQPETDQLGGRVGRNRSRNARRIILVPSSQLKKAKQMVKDGIDTSTLNAKTAPMDPIKASFLGESFCRPARLNRIYQNPDPETGYLDCIQAKRRLPCDLCRARYDLIVLPSFPPSASTDVLPPFIVPPPVTNAKKSKKRQDELKKKEIQLVRTALMDFDKQVWLEERTRLTHRNVPRSLYFPSEIIDILLTDLLKITSYSSLLNDYMRPSRLYEVHPMTAEPFFGGL